MKYLQIYIELKSNQIYVITATIKNLKMINFTKRKFERLLVSKNMMKIFYFYHYVTGGMHSGELELDFKNKKSRIEIVQKIIDLKGFKKYLEIGTFKDELFSQVNCEKKIGVDPVSGGNVRKTSNEFFMQNKEKFDLIFIDGLHKYNQAKQDIYNSINSLDNNGIILVHDCFPRNYYYQAVPRCQINWNGDTWKALVEARTDENLDTYCIYADEGIGLIFKRKNKNLLNLKIDNFSNLKYKDFFKNYKNFLNLIEYDELLNIINNNE